MAENNLVSVITYLFEIFINPLQMSACISSSKIVLPNHSRKMVNWLSSKFPVHIRGVNFLVYH